jgi:hypothetical protein
VEGSGRGQTYGTNPPLFWTEQKMVHKSRFEEAHIPYKSQKRYSVKQHVGRGTV